jgi:putative flippase GtrA
MKMEYYLAYVISLALSVVWNLTINRKATFKSDANYGIAMLKVIGYYLVFAPLTMWGGQELVNVGWNEYLVEGLTMLLNFVTEYLFFMFVVFRGKIDNVAEKTEKAT